MRALWNVGAILSLATVVACGPPTPGPVTGPGGGGGGGGGAGGQAPKRAITREARSDFASAVRKFQAAAKRGWNKSSCEDVAAAFKEVGDSHAKIAYDCYFNAGLAYDKCQLDGQALSAYQQASNRARSVIGKEYAPALVNIGRVKWRQGQKGAAEELFRRAVTNDPKLAAARNALAVALLERGRQQGGNQALFDEAIGQIRRALAVDSGNMEAYTLLALTYYEIARDDRSKLALAALVCKHAKEVSTKHAPIYNVSGLIWLKTKNVTRALDEFRTAVKLDDSHLEAHMNIGAITLSYRDYQSAETSFRRVLRRRPKDVDALIGLAVALRGKRKFDEAERVLNQVGKIDPRNPAVPFNLGLIYQDYKDYQEPALIKAKNYFNQFLSRPGAPADKVKEAHRRIKNIDDIIAANREAARLQVEMQRMEKEQAERERRQAEQERREAEAKKKAAGGKK